ncbi:MAG TPA: DUF2064 domain-containing protein [Gammaproteobacteria bacterium]|nr:DUF2064 domain-containing protein [Gammaproteobacteria bacterium]
MHNDTTLVLLFKPPRRSKRRLAEQIGALAEIAAEHLLDCALADLAQWSGPTCLAPADAPAAAYAREHGYEADQLIVQSDGNLGERIAALNAGLLAAGTHRQLFIGIDCPALDAGYLGAAAAALGESNVVLGPADDGGVVLMGINGRWPPLAELPWSSAKLGASLRRTCESANLSVATLAAHGDVDTATDLRSLPARLDGDRRASRRRLCDWILSEPSI